MDDTANVDVAKGWCRIMGLVPIALFLTCALVVRNLAVSDAFIDGEEQTCEYAGLERRRRGRRKYSSISPGMRLSTSP